MYTANQSIPMSLNRAAPETTTSIQSGISHALSLH